MIKKIPFQILALLLIIPSFAYAGTDIVYTNPQASDLPATAVLDPAVQPTDYFRKHIDSGTYFCQEL
jgi:hypothetical protein